MRVVASQRNPGGGGEEQEKLARRSQERRTLEVSSAGSKHEQRTLRKRDQTEDTQPYGVVGRVGKGRHKAALPSPAVLALS